MSCDVETRCTVRRSQEIARETERNACDCGRVRRSTDGCRLGYDASLASLRTPAHDAFHPLSHTKVGSTPARSARVRRTPEAHRLRGRCPRVVKFTTEGVWWRHEVRVACILTWKRGDGGAHLGQLDPGRHGDPRACGHPVVQADHHQCVAQEMRKTDPSNLEPTC